MFRRNFLKAGSVFLMGGIMCADFKVFGQAEVSADSLSLSQEVFADRLSTLNAQFFEPFLNTDFAVTGQDTSPVSLRLIEIVGDTYKDKSLFGKTTDSFSLIFESSEVDVLNDRIYDFSHPQMGEFSLFISGFERSGKNYQAIFSRVYL